MEHLTRRGLGPADAVMDTLAVEPSEDGRDDVVAALLAQARREGEDA